MSLSLDTSIQYIKGVGPRVAEFLHKLGVKTIDDFLTCFPRQYEDRRQLPKINQLATQQIGMIVGTIQSVTEKKTKGRQSIIECRISDESACLKAIWFNQKFLIKRFKIGLKIVIKGKVDYSLYDEGLTMQVSDYELLFSKEDVDASVGRIIPIYPLTAGLYQTQMRQISKEIWAQKPHLLLKDPLPSHCREPLQLSALSEAVYQLHVPSHPIQCEKARQRVVFDEFFYHQLHLGQRRLKIKRELDAPLLKGDNRLVAKYLKSLPYQLTGAQKKAIKVIKEDIGKPAGMNRLLQGDVGSGKTDVALVSLLTAIESGKSGVMMAPTEILAIQHYYKFLRYLEPLGVSVLLLKGKMKAAEKRAVLEELKEEKPRIVVGTHALIQDHVDMANVGLVIIDEQHRFGVVQRQNLKGKGVAPHCLFMTATPIPRTFMLTCYGDLDKSVIDEMPPGRQSPKTYFVKQGRFFKVMDHCIDEVKQGRQLYLVYPLVEESEKMDLKSAIEGWEQIKSRYEKEGVNVGLIHGRMKPDEKKEIMTQFNDNKIQVLVATTVIEVGIDVPNATMMVIMHAERFGLSQLHQLRGRIGRGKEESSCYLIGDAKTDTGKKRLHAMLETADGFKIAEYDLLIRGPGDMLGTRQSGLPEFYLADLIRDEDILLKARDVAKRILEEDPNLTSPTYKPLQTMCEKLGFRAKDTLN